METLFQSVGGGISWYEPMDELRNIKLGSLYLVMFYVYIGFVYFAVLNVVTSLFCQAAVENSVEDQDVLLEKKIVGQSTVKQKLTELFAELEQKTQSDEGLFFSQEELEQFLEDRRVRGRLSLLGIEAADASTLFNLICKLVPRGSQANLVDAETFVAGCMKLKGEASRLDLELLAQSVDNDMRNICQVVTDVVNRLDRLKHLEMIELKHLNSIEEVMEDVPKHLDSIEVLMQDAFETTV
jgi:hypothetical protein